MIRRTGILKRVADVPVHARAIDRFVSKADLLEVAWSLAALCNGDSCDDDMLTMRRLLEEINVYRQRSDRRPISIEKAHRTFERLVEHWRKRGATVS